MGSGRKVRRGKALTFSCPFAAKSEEEQETETEQTMWF